MLSSAKKNRWKLFLLVCGGIGLVIMGRFLNESYTLGTHVTYGSDPLAQRGAAWNSKLIKEVAALGRSSVTIDPHVPHTIRMDETSPVAVLVPGAIGKVTRRTLDRSLASVDYPVRGTAWGEKGPCIVWRFNGVDLDGEWDCGGIEVHIIDRRSEEHTFHISFASRTATVPLVPGQSMRYVILPDMTRRPNNTRLLEKRDTLDVVFPDVTGKDDVELISVTILEKTAAYNKEAAGYAYETLNQENRPIMYQWTDGTCAWDVHLAGEHPLLKFGNGLLSHTQPVTFSVLVECENRVTLLFSKTLEQGDNWNDQVIDLAPWKKRSVRILFKVRSNTSAVALWSSPRIVEAKRKGRLFCIYLVDALRPDFCEGFATFRGRENSTPGIRRLSQRGVTFTHALANAPITKYSMSSLFTGLYPSHSGIIDYQRVPDDIETLAEVFRQNGFMTASFLFNSNAGRLRGLHQGFDYTFSMGRLYREARNLQEKHSRDIYGETPTLTSGGMINDFLFNFLRTYREEDTFLFLHLMDTHAPYFPDAEYLNEFYLLMSQRGLAVPKDPAMLLDELKYTQRPRYVPEDHLSEDALLELYRGAVKTADKHLQRFMDFLTSEGMDREATLVFTSDHGEHLNEHPDIRLFTHMHPMLLEVLRVPLVIDSPAFLPSGKAVVHAVQLADVMPTLLDLAGIPYDPAHYDGVSLLGLMAGEDHTFFQKRPIVSQTSPSLWSVLLGDTHSPDITRGYDVKVYNLREDPREHQPLPDGRAGGELARLVHSLSMIPHRQVPGTETIINDEETLEQLRELGYIE